MSQMVSPEGIDSMPDLPSRHWEPEAYRRLTGIVERESGSGKAAVFDWDNTTQARDIQTATIAQQLADGEIPEHVMPGSAPAFTEDGNEIQAEGTSILEYAEALSLATAHSTTNRNAWETQSWAGLSLRTVVAAAARAYADGAGAEDRDGISTTGVADGHVLRPFLLPEMIDLFGMLLRHGYAVYVISASPVWVVRWLVNTVMNPRLEADWKVERGLPLDHVLGATTLLKDRHTGELTEELDILGDASIRDRYLESDADVLDRFLVTAHLSLPYPSGWGKPAILMERATLDPPYLAAGDSPEGDHGNFARAENRLWMARLLRPEHQIGMHDIVTMHPPEESWMIQPVISGRSPGLVRSRDDLEARLGRDADDERLAIERSLETLIRNGRLDADRWAPEPGGGP